MKKPNDQRITDKSRTLKKNPLASHAINTRLHLHIPHIIIELLSDTTVSEKYLIIIKRWINKDTWRYGSVTCITYTSDN